MSTGLTKRDFLTGAASAITAAIFPRAADATATANPPIDRRENYLAWMVEKRGEEPILLEQRWARFVAMRANGDLDRDEDARAFLLTPREEFVLKGDVIRAYDEAYLDIGHGSTITGPHVVGRMTSAAAVSMRDRVLEIGTGSGYQSAYLANLAEHVWTIECVRAHHDRARRLHERLSRRGLEEYGRISSLHGDGYLGWEQAAPFDKIIVTCAVDHIPRSLLEQLKPDGSIILPLGPAHRQSLVKVTRARRPNGSFKLVQTGICPGRTFRFVKLRRFES